MNCKQAQNIRIVDYLKKVGIEPTKIYGENAWYCSPIRKEKNPSFKVNLSKNRWFDVATETGGDIIELVKLYNSTDLSGALQILAQPELSKPIFSFSDKQKESSIDIKHIQSLQNNALIQYIKNRGIPFSIAKSYLKEAYYNIGSKRFFAIAFENDKGGFELRNGVATKSLPTGFKGSTSPKYFTTINGSKSTYCPLKTPLCPPKRTINLFEGFFDFLSALTHYQTTAPNNTTIVLNSLSNMMYAESIIKQYKKVNCYLDNDSAGNKYTVKLMKMNIEVVNQSKKLYPQFKDFNDFLLNTK